MLVELRDAGTTVLIAEQSMRATLGIADRAYLLDRGTVVSEGSAEAIATDGRVATAYLGDSMAER